MNNEERKHIEDLINIQKRRLRHLEKQKVTEGPMVNPSISMEIEDIEQGINDLKEQLALARATVVKLFTRPGARPATGTYLDWSDYYEDNEYPSDIWQKTWLTKLKDILEHHSTDSVLFLSGRAHLSAGIAFGYTFPVPMNVPVWVEQPINNHKSIQIWKSTDHWDGPALLTARSHFNPDAETDDLLIDISIVHSTESAVANFLEPMKKRFREHITIKPKQRGDKVIQDGAQAVHMAHFVRTQIMEKGVSGATTHIVGSFPLGLAVFIGMHLNACGSIQCYEHKEKHEDEGVHKTYVPTCLLVRQ